MSEEFKIGVSINPKNTKMVVTDMYIHDEFVEGFDYYLFIVEGRPTKLEEASLLKHIHKSGIKSFVIVSALNGVFVSEEVSGSLTDFVRIHKTRWDRFLTYKGVKCRAAMVFGSGMYAVNGSADIIVKEFYETKMNKPYYYLGHYLQGKKGRYDSFFFPVDSLSQLFPTEYKKGKPFKPGYSTENFKTRFFYEQLQNIQGRLEYPSDMRDITLHISKSERESMLYLYDLENQKELAWDTETTSLFRYVGNVFCLTLCANGVDGYYIPFEHVKDNPDIKEQFYKCLYTAGTTVYANGKFDILYVKNELPDLDLDKIDITDIQQMAHDVDSGRSVGLKPLEYFYGHMGGYDDILDVFKKQFKVDNYADIPRDMLAEYATIDAIATWRILQEIKRHMDYLDKNFPSTKNKWYPNGEVWGFKKWYYDIMKPTYPMFVETEFRGTDVDVEYMDIVRGRLNDRILGLREALSKVWNVPPTFDFTSSTQLGAQIAKMGWPCIQVSEAGGYATNDDCIFEWQQLGMPGIDLLIEFRATQVLIQTYIGKIGPHREKGGAEGWEKHIVLENNHTWAGNVDKSHPNDSDEYKIHQTYIVMGTETFRCKGREPNFQNIPTHSDLAVEVKRCITVPSSYVYEIEDDKGNLYRGGANDTIKVIREGKEIKVRLELVEETDDPVPGSFEKYVPKYDAIFEGIKDNAGGDKDPRKLFANEITKTYSIPEAK